MKGINKEGNVPEWYRKIEEETKTALQELSDESYAAFSSNLLPGVKNILGVRLPMLRKLAKTLVKKIPGEDGIFQYLELAKDQSFEEIMLQGFVIGYSDLTDDRMYKAVEVFLPRIDNWSVCDSFCTTIKRFPKDRKRCFAFLLDCLGRAEERTYDRRFAIVMMLLYYIDEEYIECVLKAMEQVSSNQYYVNMARAWGISMCYIKYPERTTAFLSAAKLDDFTYRLSIRKICESTVVSKEAKEEVKKLYRSRSKTVNTV